jgi:3-hydroxyacyl-CoA dehydrogenase/enoyl-CoA hydratase/3-hydroxybutyryl-CoA epimerase/enoyl-CoA isomerase
MFKGKTLQLEPLNDGLIELRFDRTGESVNKFDRLAIDELRRAVDVMSSTPGARGLLVTSAKDSFIVGADIFEFTALFASTEAQIEAINAEQASVFTALAASPVPTVAAINGMAFGGGFELPLACDHRVMAQTAVVGLPEVTLGIMPGYGGSVRLPRIAGCATALNWITSGAPQKAQAALQAGAVDAVVAPAELRGAALAWLAAAADGKVDWQSRRRATRGALTVDASMLEQALASTAKTAAHYPAAAAFVRYLADTAGLDADAAQVQEARVFARLAKTPTAAALVRMFLNDQYLKKKAKAYAQQARPVKQAAVLGAGIMGGGIAYTSAVKGTPVLMKDINDKALELGMAEADRLLAKQVESQRITAEKAARLRASIQPTLQYAGFDRVDVVVEAVVENLEIKKKVLREVEGMVKPGCVLASNTSSLSITEMARELEHPQNFVGMHFFNPVPVMPLVEVVRGPKTESAATATAAGYATAMGKTPIVVKDCPGFLVNRILTPYFIAFLRLVHDGADYQQVDRAMEAFGWPMGPAYLADVIGMDTLHHVLEVISNGYRERMTTDFPLAIALMVEGKRLGQKSGAGFYRYETDTKGKPRKLQDPHTAELLATIQPHGHRDFSDPEIVDRVMLPMVLEAARCLEEGIADSAVEVDMGLVLGLGFPRYLGGALNWTDSLGIANIVTRCERYAQLSPMYRPSDATRERGAAGKRFHA